jgi:hypothetical protein
MQAADNIIDSSQLGAKPYRYHDYHSDPQTINEAFFFFSKESENAKDRIEKLEVKVDSNEKRLTSIEDILEDICRYSKWVARGVGFICVAVITKIIEVGISNLF